jgi:hypothetical protein
MGIVEELADRLTGERYGNDEPVGITIVDHGHRTSWRAPPEETVWVPERLFCRIQSLAGAYELRILPHIDIYHATRLNREQCEALETELDFIRGLTRDPLLPPHIDRILDITRTCLGIGGSHELEFEGP